MDSYTKFTSESVSEGHPDKVADQVSDAILDALLKQDPDARVAVETLLKDDLCVIAGEVTTEAKMGAEQYEQVVRQTIVDIGYDDTDKGFDGNNCRLINAISEQSPDIAQGIDKDSGLGAGDQGIMYGYATRETDSFMPAPIHYAHKLMQRQAQLRKSGALPWLRPDAKSQITFRYDDSGKPLAIETVVLSTQHSHSIKLEDLRQQVRTQIIDSVLPSEWLNQGNKDTVFHINPTGKFEIGGPASDCGLTGRKVIVDTYGGMARHGGGAFSGKDPTKVDRSAAYAGRYIAKNIVAAGLAERCEIQISYSIGIPEPTSISINTFGSEQVGVNIIKKLVREHFELTPAAIIKALQLKEPIYLKTAAYGHFGRNNFSWENTDKAAILRRYL